MRVLHLVTSLDFGGLERRMQILSDYPSDDSEIIFCSLSGGGACHDKMLSNGSNVILLNQDCNIFRIKTFVHVIKMLLRVNPDVIHTHGAEANFYGMLAARLVGVRLRIAEEIGIPAYSSKSRLVFTFALKFCNRLIAMSPAVKDFLISQKVVPACKVDLVYNPVLMPDKIKPATDIGDGLRFAFLGRLEKVKNPDGLLRAFSRAYRKWDGLRLDFVGGGRMEQELKDYASKNGLDDKVTFHGFSNTPFDIIKKADVVVQPSHTEGFSLALVEAMGCGLPVLATPAGGASDLIKKSSGGWAVKSSSDEDLLEGISFVIENKASLGQVGALAAQYVRGRFDAKRYAGILDEYYRKTASSL